MKDKNITKFPLIKIEDLTVSQNFNLLFKNFNLNIFEKDIIGLYAPTGSGKTTLLNLLSGLTLSNDFNVKGLISKIPDLKFSYVFQESRLLEHVSVLKNVMLPLTKSMSKLDAEKKAVYYLSKLELGNKLYQKAGNLSGGEKQRVSIARAFVYPSDVLLLDEPFGSQDLTKKKKLIAQTLDLIQTEGKTCIIVSHDKEDLEEMNARLITYEMFK